MQRTTRFGTWALLAMVAVALGVACQTLPPVEQQPASDRPVVDTSGTSAVLADVPLDPQESGPPLSRRLLRVLLVGSRAALPVSIDGPYQILREDRTLVRSQAGRLSGPIQAAGQGLTWDGLAIHEPSVWLVPAVDGSVRVDGTPYRGAVHIVRDKDNLLSAINVVDVELYLQGLDEMPASFQFEAHRAQMVAARTFALFEKATTPKGQSWDLLANEGSQVYRGIKAEVPLRVRAARSTAGVVLTWQGPTGQRIFPAYFSSNSGGVTQDSQFVKGRREAEPLRGGVVTDGGRSSSTFSWGPVTLSEVDVTKGLTRYPRIAALGRITQIEVVQRTPEGRNALLRLSNVRGQSEQIRGEDFRLCMGSHRVRSSWFDIRKDGRNFVLFNGRGFGHGMGLCQFGANGLARQQASAEQILLTYYPGSVLAQAYEHTPGQEPRIEAVPPELVQR